MMSPLKKSLALLVVGVVGLVVDGDIPPMAEQALVVLSFCCLLFGGFGAYQATLEPEITPDTTRPEGTARA